MFEEEPDEYLSRKTDLLFYFLTIYILAQLRLYDIIGYFTLFCAST